MNTYVTHPSVRIKGTENNMSPVRCVDQRCGDSTVHMHCPFCVKTDLYHDPVILKAHYRVKHVDKGIDFAGLKILRCCDHCDIVGIIKGEKKFKGAHWHCYKCRNGFNRRDEAIKHYKTHFRNPQTTFQIQIAQEVYASKYDDATTSTVETTAMSIHPALTEAVMSTTVTQDLAVTQPTHITLPNGKSSEVHTSVAAEETVDTAQTHHIMIIHEDPIDGTNTYTTQVISGEDVNLEEEKERAEDQNIDNNQFEDLQQKYEKLQMEKLMSEQSMKTEISELQSQVNELRNEIANYQKREQEYLEQLSVPLDKNIENILKQMENQHRSLLHQHLLNLKREYKPVPLVLNSMSTETSQFLPQTNIGELSHEVSPTTAELGQEVSPPTSMCSDSVSSSNLDMTSSVNLEDNITEKMCTGAVTGQKIDKIQLETTGAGDNGNPFVVCIQYQDDSDGKSVIVDLPEESGDIIEEPIAKRIKTS